MTTDVFRRLDVALDGVARTGVVHVGAHRGQEVADYQAAGFERIVLVEANPALWPALSRIPGTVLHRCAAGRTGDGILHVTTWDERSSLLAPLEDPLRAQITIPVRPLSELQEGCNVAVLDCQGSELDVLRTADLTRLDALVVECCDRPRYRGAATSADIASFLSWSGWEEHRRYGGHSSPDLFDAVWRPRCA